MANKERLIDANRAQELAEACLGDIFMRTAIKLLLEKCHTVDAVPVVRCKDCRYWVREFDNVGHCTYAGIHLDHAEYGFCSYGERKNDE